MASGNNVVRGKIGSPCEETMALNNEQTHHTCISLIALRDEDARKKHRRKLYAEEGVFDLNICEHSNISGHDHEAECTKNLHVIIAFVKLEEYETAKTTLENGASLAPRNSRFINFIKECDERRAGTKQEEVKVAGDALASTKNIGAAIMVCMKCFKKGEHYTSMCPYLILLLQLRPSLIGRLHQKTQLFQPVLPMEHTFLQA
ncbi:Eukaryotic translation initiation factor 3 subunit G [Forsythia ovata]|uniref:Eukaryotic translation initiation factor 3 subunit G n=1 Tax=Forsythia ovata TaxID=205694 RepID=A0ABD1T8W0_9LAMI